MTDESAPRALFAISSLGLGHATRTLVVLRDYLRSGFQVTVVSTGNTLAFLRLELASESRVAFLELTDYPPLERGRGWRLYAYLLLDLARTWWRIRREHHVVEAMAGDYDFIFSDGRYGFHSKRTPSFILSHQIAFVAPRGLGWSTGVSTAFNIATFARFDCLFVADFPDRGQSLAGDLAHVPALSGCEHRFVGMLSSYQHLGLERDIDYLFVISGYLVEHKGSFVRTLLEQSRGLPGRKAFVLGNASGDERAYASFRSHTTEIHGVASGDLRQQLFARARNVISRAGYTTVMDLAEHDKRALLIPTPNQTEQEYLARWLGGRGWYVTRGQGADFDLVGALAAMRDTRTFVPPWRTAESVRRIRERIDRQLERRFVSVVVPAHNEESEIQATLRCLLRQRYPDDRMEVLVVENGSSDHTLAIAESLSRSPEARGRVRVLTSSIGVSRAKNAGLEALSPDSEWVVFCDADTHLEPNFLHELNTWLRRHEESAPAVGTFSVRPRAGAGRYARLWFAYHRLMHRLTRSSQSIQFARTDVAREVRFREALSLGEDLEFIRGCRRHGRFLMIDTDQVATSTRRFEACGYLRQSLRWLVGALLPARLRERVAYDVIR